MDTNNDEIPENLKKFSNFPIKFLHFSARSFLSLHLNPIKITFSSFGYVQDWRGVGEQLDMTPLHLENFKQLQDPFSQVLSNCNPDNTLGNLFQALFRCERFDILEDDNFSSILSRYPKHLISNKNNDFFEERRNEIVTMETTKRLTVGEDNGEEYFDAYVCYTSEDLEFVKVLVYELEEVGGLKLCIPDRDTMPGSFTQETNTKLIKDRCRKMIAILSPSYLESEECKFFTVFASSLEPGYRGEKLIPVVYKNCKIPDILIHVTKIYYTRSDVISWFWMRLLKSIQEPNQVLNNRLNTSNKNGSLLMNQSPNITSKLRKISNSSNYFPPKYYKPFLFPLSSEEQKKSDEGTPSSQFSSKLSISSSYFLHKKLIKKPSKESSLFSPSFTEDLTTPPPFNDYSEISSTSDSISSNGGSNKNSNSFHSEEKNLNDDSKLMEFSSLSIDIIKPAKKNNKSLFGIFFKNKNNL